jgi:aspartate 1-decarboxylase
MLLSLLKCKIHRATVTESNLDYLGSLSIDEELIELAGLHEYEEIMVANIANGERLYTYVLKAPRNSRVIGANGAAAHKIKTGDEIIIFSFALYDRRELDDYKPRLVFVDRLNNPVAGPMIEHHADLLETHLEP